ncbi:RNA-guided endonuclease TnpB family protein, partial [Roseibium sp. RKSG952]|uniref:RNA-guided endonuclease InsQ/TnpB family protein n=1 Tax=Roseibium sp. RKSG952 TaxID=2529384 RepID=UPI0012BD716D
MGYPGLNRQFGIVRFVWNRALAAKKHYFKVRGKNLSPTRDLKPLLAVAKKSRKYGWVAQADSIALQEALRNLQTAFQKFFDPKLNNGFPRFKSKHGKQGSYHCMSVSIGDGWIKIPKCPRIKARVHRAANGKVNSITISKTSTGKYYASVLVEDGTVEPEAKKALSAQAVTGVDLGLSHLCIYSNGEKQKNPRFLKRAAINLRRKQKTLSRKKKGSRNRAKARLLVAKAHERIANTRNDFQHKLSKRLIDDNQAVCVETLK